MPFKVEISETRTVKRTLREYQRLRSRELVDDEHPEFGYVENVGAEVVREVKVYEQTVDDLELKRVILAINGIEGRA